VNAANPRRRHDDRLGALGLKELANGSLVSKIEFMVRSQHQIGMALPPKGPDHCRTHQSPVAGNVNP
jgi:hypothetical protein